MVISQSQAQLKQNLCDFSKIAPIVIEIVKYKLFQISNYFKNFTKTQNETLFSNQVPCTNWLPNCLLQTCTLPKCQNSLQFESNCQQYLSNVIICCYQRLSLVGFYTEIQIDRARAHRDSLMEARNYIGREAKAALLLSLISTSCPVLEFAGL